jgi:hypothetical protein
MTLKKVHTCSTRDLAGAIQNRFTLYPKPTLAHFSPSRSPKPSDEEAENASGPPAPVEAEDAYGPPCILAADDDDAAVDPQNSSHSAFSLSDIPILIPN